MEKIKVVNLRKQTKDFLLHDINIRVHSGEIFALVGIQNSGKTMLSKILQKLAFADGGYFDIKDNPGYVIPDQMFYPNQTVLQTMEMFNELHKRGANRAEILNVLNMVGLRKKRNVRVKHLSPNRYERLKIAVAVLARPNVLILDAPFSYMSDIEARYMRVILKTLADKFGTAILLTAVSFFGIEEIFDTVAIIDGGKIVTIHSYNELTAHYERFAKTCITTPSPNYTAKLIHEKFGFKTHLWGDNDVIVTAPPTYAQQIYDFLLEAKVPVNSVSRVNKSIENMFHELRTQSYRPDEVPV
jgi:ABC-2 type transport system ATP-binding protein